MARALLGTGMVHAEGLQLYRWLTGVEADPPAGAEAEIRMMTRAVALGTGLTDSWIDGLYGKRGVSSEARQARDLIAEANGAGASRCIAHQVQDQPAAAPLRGYALERFKDGELPAYARVVHVQYRCITSYISAPRVLGLAMVHVLETGQRPADGALLADLQAAMERDRRWPVATGGTLQLLSFWNGRHWSGDQKIVEALAAQMLAREAPRPVDAAVQSGMFADFTAQTASGPTPSEVVSQILLWIPPLLRESLRGDVEAYVAAASRQEARCRPVEAQYIDEDGQHARVEVQCNVPALEHLPVPAMATTLDRDTVLQQYRQVLAALQDAAGDARGTRITGFTTLQRNADTAQWELHPGAAAALRARGLLPTPVVDEWGKPSNISRYLPAVLHVQNIDPAALDEETREKIRTLGKQMAEAMTGIAP